MNEATATVIRLPAPVREQVVRILRGAILNGQLAVGRRLTERELVALVGASRTTIREALRQLEAEGLVKVLPGKGPAVAGVSPAEAAQLYEVRAVLEGLAARLFAERANDETVADLQSAVRNYQQACRRNDLSEMLEAKDRLYEVLFRGSGNEILHGLAVSVNARIRRLRSFSLSQKGRVSQSLQEIRAVLEAIRHRDPDGAEQLSKKHVHNAARVALDALEATDPAGQSSRVSK